jgi:hypothetical protein
MTMKLTNPKQAPKARQRGVATLVISGVLLFVITLAGIVAARTVLMETRVTANEHRSMQAFNSAQAGLDFYAALLALGGVDRTDGSISIPVDANGLPIIDIDDFLDGGNCVPGGGVQFDFTFEGVGAPGFFNVISEGFSDDCVGVRRIHQRLAIGLGELPDFPKFALIAAAGVAGGGNAHNMINPEVNLTIWTGQNHDPSQSNTLVSNPADPCDYANDAVLLKDCLPQGNQPGQVINDKGLSVIANDVNLALLAQDGEFFEAFFGETEQEFLAAGKAEITSVADFGGLLSEGPVIGGSYWVDGDLGFQTPTIGCSTDVAVTEECGRADHDGEEMPSLLIVDGNLTIQGNPVVYGLLYVKGDLVVNGTLRVYGAIVVEGQVGGNGNVDSYFSSLTLGAVSTGLSAVTLVPGSWRDWDI